MKVLLSFLFIFLLISLVSANGLLITPNNFNVNKTAGINTNIIFNITNMDTKVFNNVSIQNNSYITFSPIASIQPGQIMTVTGTINSNANINTSLRIRGYYMTDVGSQNKFYNINISSYTAPITPCDFSIIKGDTLNFSNKLNNAIIIKDVNNNQDVTTIPPNSFFPLQMNMPTSFKYTIYISGFQLSSVCTVTVLDTQGLVNDPTLDGILNLNIKNSYEPTNVTLNLLTNNFSMDFFDTKDAIMTVTNTGNKKAYDVTLSGEWMSFSANHFDLGIGESKGIIYTVSPVIMTTTDTNKTYIKPMKANGNFNEVTSGVSVFVNYANFDTNTTSKADVDYLLKVFCPNYPNSVLCNGTGQNIIYKYINNASDETFNVTMSQSQVRDLWLYLFQTGDKIDTLNNYMKEQIEAILTNQSTSNMKVNNLLALTEDNKKSQDSAVSNVLILAVIIMIVIVGSIVGILIYLYRREKKIMEYRTW